MNSATFSDAAVKFSAAPEKSVGATFNNRKRYFAITGRGNFTQLPRCHEIQRPWLITVKETHCEGRRWSFALSMSYFQHESGDFCTYLLFSGICCVENCPVQSGRFQMKSRCTLWKNVIENQMDLTRGICGAISAGLLLEWIQFSRGNCEICLTVSRDRRADSYHQHFHMCLEFDGFSNKFWRDHETQLISPEFHCILF